MRRLFHLAVLAAFIFSSSTAFAQVKRYCDLGTLLSAVEMDGLVGTRTFTVGPSEACDNINDTAQKVAVGSYKYLVLCSALTTDESTALVTTHLVGKTVATATFSPTQCSTTSGGTCTGVKAGITSHTLAGAGVSVCYRYGIQGYPAHSIVMSLSSADSADLLTLTGYLAD